MLQPVLITPNQPLNAFEEADEYLNYIGYRGDRNPGLNALSEIQRLHTEVIPFENLNPLLKQPVLLDQESVKKKLLRSGRGGYCFEQNALFAHHLELMGFTVKRLAARVLWNVPEGVIAPRAHMLLLVELEQEGPYIADVGFGGQSITGPVKFVVEEEQQTPHEPCKIIAFGEEFVLQTKIRNQWKSLYRFDLQEQLPLDYEAPNWYTSNHPKSIFTYNLIAARTRPGKRYVLRNNEFTVHHLQGSSETKIIKSADELKDLLRNIFKINLEGLQGLDEKLEEIIKLHGE
jgi:N-hydroxyarylamine O-acetyltransferase